MQELCEGENKFIKNMAIMWYNKKKVGNGKLKLLLNIVLEWVYKLNSFKKKGLFETFFENRSSLIIQYQNGDLTKREFLEYNYDIVRKSNLKPFLKVDSYEKGMYNYQYYNVLAKYYTMLAKEIKNTKKHQKYIN